MALKFVFAACAGALCQATLGGDGSRRTMWSAPPAAYAYEKPPEEVFTHRFKKFKLGEVINLAENVAIFRFLLPSADDEFSMVACSTLQVLVKRGTNRPENITRAYTPITLNGTRGYFDILVKKQPKGQMTEALFSMDVGEHIQARVVGHKLKYTPNRWKNIGMIGGGTGITPLLQILNIVLRDKADHTKTSLLFCNRTDHKILLRGELEQLAKTYAERFKLFMAVDLPAEPSIWKGYVGHITEKLVRETMPPPAKENLLLVCGPDAMVTHLTGVPTQVLQAMSGGRPEQPVHTHMNNLGKLSGLLGQMGYDGESVYRF